MKLTALAVILTSCRATEDPNEAKPAPQGRPEIVGRIASIPPGNSFALIQSYGDWKVVDGTILTTRGADGRTANLLVTGEKLGQFAAADIQAGELVVGDAVLLLPALAPRPAPQSEEVEIPANEEAEAH